MTRNYWVQAAQHRKRASSGEDAIQEDSTYKALQDAIANNEQLKAELDGIFGNHLDTYRKVRQELESIEESDDFSPKLKSAL
ncbi:TPA: hypothetical protein O4F91_001716 [Vibrio alginolyticus]|nr:hypothetical protein [Vibrio alginolyticus]HCZ9053804.1 hypothetical protein [Vibrio alginolyticus]